MYECVHGCTVLCVFVYTRVWFYHGSTSMCALTRKCGGTIHVAGPGVNPHPHHLDIVQHLTLA